jgi:hypothetical protein
LGSSKAPDGTSDTLDDAAALEAKLSALALPDDVRKVREHRTVFSTTVLSIEDANFGSL